MFIFWTFRVFKCANDLIPNVENQNKFIFQNKMIDDYFYNCMSELWIILETATDVYHQQKKIKIQTMDANH